MLGSYLRELLIFFSCLLVNGKKLGQYFYEFVKKVSEVSISSFSTDAAFLNQNQFLPYIKLLFFDFKENKAIAEKIHNDFQQVCMKKPNLLFTSVETFNLGEQFECIVDAIGDASKANGFSDVWSKTQPKFKNHLDTWKQCGSAGSKLKIVLYVPFYFVSYSKFRKNFFYLIFFSNFVCF